MNTNIVLFVGFFSAVDADNSLSYFLFSRIHSRAHAHLLLKGSHNFAKYILRFEQFEYYFFSLYTSITNHIN